MRNFCANLKWEQTQPSCLVVGTSLQLEQLPGRRSIQQAQVQDVGDKTFQAVAAEAQTPKQEAKSLLRNTKS